MTAPLPPVLTASIAGAQVLGVAAPVLKGNAGAAVTVDWGDGPHQKLTLNAPNCTVTLVAPSGGPCTEDLLLYLTQDATGGRAVLLPSPLCKWRGASLPVLSVAPNAVDLVRLTWDGANYWC